MVAVFNTFTLGFGHKVEVNRLTGNNSTERTVFHNNNTVAKFREKEGGLGRNRVFDNFWSVVDRCGRLSGAD